MNADSGEMVSQARQARQLPDDLAATLHEQHPDWPRFREAWKALMSWSREVRAETRNQRHVAILRRALTQKIH